MARVTRPGAVKLAALALLLSGLAVPAGADDCDRLEVRDGNRFAFRAYAEGVQIYRWNGAKWDFVAPEATLYDEDGEVVAIHYAGPTWESESGSKVVGAVIDRCTPDPTAIPWLLLGAVSTEGPGVFSGVTYIQRLNTVGGLAPATPGAYAGEVARVPYAANYYFYRRAND